MPKIVDHDQMRRKIASIACTTMADLGLEGTSMRVLAQAAGCTTGMITHYFPNKNALMIAAIRLVSSMQLDNMARVADGQPENLIAIIRRGLPIAKEDRIAFKVWLALWSISTTNVELSSIQKQVHRNYLALYARILTGANALEEKDDKMIQAERLSLIINGLSIQVLQNPSEWPSERQTSEIESILRKLLPRWGGQRQVRR